MKKMELDEKTKKTLDRVADNAGQNRKAWN